MNVIKTDKIDIGEIEKKKYYFNRDICIMVANDVIYSSDAYILDVINAKSDEISEDDKLMLESLLFEAFDNKALCPEITIMKDESGNLTLRSEDPYKPNMSNLDLVAILVKTKKQPIITREAWKYLMERYPTAPDNVLPTVLNQNTTSYYTDDNSFILIDDTNMMPYNETNLVNLIMPNMTGKLITIKNGKDVITKMVYEKKTDLENRITITLIVSEFDNVNILPLLFNMWFTNEKLQDNILEHIGYNNTLIQDSIVNKLKSKEVELVLTGTALEDRSVLPYVLVDLWDPHLETNLQIINMYYEQLEKERQRSNSKF